MACFVCFGAGDVLPVRSEAHSFEAVLVLAEAVWRKYFWRTCVLVLIAGQDKLCQCQHESG